MSELNKLGAPEGQEISEAERRLEAFKQRLGKELMALIPAVNFNNQPLLDEDKANLSNVLVPVLVDRIVAAISKLPEDMQVELYEGNKSIWELSGNEMVYKLMGSGAEWRYYGDQRFEIKTELLKPELLQELSNVLGVIEAVRSAQLLLERSLKQNYDGSGNMDGSFGKVNALLNFIGNLMGLDEANRKELLDLVCADAHNEKAKEVRHTLGIDWATITDSELKLVLNDNFKLPPDIVGVVQAVWRLANPNSTQVSPFINDTKFKETTIEGVAYQSQGTREATLGGFAKMIELLEAQAAKGVVELPPLTYADAMRELDGVQAQQAATNQQLEQVLAQGGGKDKEIADLEAKLAEERRLKDDAVKQAVQMVQELRDELTEKAKQAVAEAELKASEAVRKAGEAERKAREAERKASEAEAKIQAALEALGGFVAPGVFNKGNGQQVVVAAEKALKGDK